jgi:hypothetical protein
MIRRATEADVPAVTALVHELAAYEKSSSLCTVRDEQLRSALFGAQPSVFAHVAEHEGTVVGCALWLHKCQIPRVLRYAPPRARNHLHPSIGRPGRKSAVCVGAGTGVSRAV